MYSFLEKCMHSVDDNCFCNSSAVTLLVNHVQILVCSSPKTLGMSLMMLLWARGIVTMWCSKGGDKTDNVFDLMQFQYFPVIATVFGKVLDNEPHQRRDFIFSSGSFAKQIANLPV